MKKTITAFSILSLLAFFACEKDGSIPDRFTPTPEGNANVKFLNMSPGTQSVNFFGNGAKISATTPSGTAATTVTGVTYPGIYPNTIGYATVPTGSLKVDAKVPDSATIMPGATILSATQSFAAAKFYTMVLLDTITQAKAVVTEDDPSVPDQTKAYLRIANFAADSAVNVVVTKTSPGYSFTRTYTNVAPRTILQFDTVGAGAAHAYSVTFSRASNNAVLGTVVSVSTAQAKKYTAYVRGLLRAPTTIGGGSYTNF